MGALNQGRPETLAQVALLVLGCSCIALLMLSSWQLNQVTEPVIRAEANEDLDYDEGEEQSINESQLIKFKPELVLEEDEIEQLIRSKRLEEQVLALNSSRLLHLENITYPIENIQKFTCQRPQRVLSSGENNSERRRLKLLIVINSKWSNHRRRQRLRNTWLAPNRLLEQVCSQHESIIDSFEYVFMIGKPPQVGGEEEDFGQQKLEQEAKQKGDIVQVNLVDNYRALSVKHLSIFKWILGNHLKQVNLSAQQDTLLLKCDDDAHIELGQLLDFYRLQQNEGWHGNWISCASFPENTHSQRLPDRKWSLSHHEFPYDTFPAYCSGLAYLAPVSYVRLLFLLAHLVAPLKQEPPLWVDDVFVTGILGASLRPRAKIYQLNAHFCYTKALRLHRKQLKVPCMVSEIDKPRE